MIHYHGTPCGGTRDNVVKFLRRRCALVSFARPEDLGAALLSCHSVVLDNGAYTVWKQGGALDVAGYARWVKEIEHHPAVAWALLPDVIDGTEEENDRLLDECACRYGLEGVPVYHLHESLERAERLSRDFERIAIGSSGRWPRPNRPGWWRRIAEVMDAVCEEGKPRCKLHGLRMLNPEVFKRLPLASADSTNAVQNGAREAVKCGCSTLQGMTLIAEEIESVQSAAKWEPHEEETLFTLES